MSVIKVKNIVKAEQSADIVFNYTAKDFPLVAGPSAQAFISKQEFTSTDFQISPLVAEQAGITRLREEALNDKIEEDALQKLKGVQEKAYKEAYELGLIEGCEKAFQENKEIFSQRIANLDSILHSIENMKQNLLADHEAHILKFIFELASRIAMREIKAQPESIMPVIQQVITDTQTEEKVTIQVSPDDLEFIEHVKEKIGKEGEALRRIRFEPSEAIESGGCLLETNYGSIDATIEMRLQRAWEVIDEKLPKPEQRSKKDEGKE